MRDTDKTREEIARELTELRQKIAKLRDERDLMRALIDNLPNLLYIKDTKGRFAIGNAAVARLMGAKVSEELVGKTDFDFYPKELAAAYYSKEQEVIQSGESMINHEEALLKVVTGERGWLSTTRTPLRDDKGKIIGIVVISTDITAEKRRESKWGK
jgi:PAS domain S-box-containing protein